MGFHVHLAFPFRSGLRAGQSSSSIPVNNFFIRFVHRDVVLLEHREVTAITVENISLGKCMF